MATPSAPAVSSAPRRGLLALSAAVLLGSASPGAALDLGLRDAGLRGGLSLNPDQVHAGLHAQVGPGRTFSFRPSLELGLGNGVRLAALNGDLLLRRSRGRWRPYLGGGPGLNLVDVTDGVGEARGAEAKAVASVVVGVARAGAGRQAKPERYLLELRAGLGDTPDLKLTLGMTF